ncbi:N-acetyl-anhydromuramyl-L-alanine amidase AmpD [Arthrobacter sp. UYEF20]
MSTTFIDPGSPRQDGAVKSFNAHFRREQYSGETIDPMVEAKR